jgi:hypothetical protein
MRTVVEVDNRRRVSLARVLPDLQPGQRFTVYRDCTGVLMLVPVVDVRADAPGA